MAPVDPVSPAVESPRISHEAFLHAVGRAVIATDVAGKVVFWNRFAEQLYGWSSAEALGRDITQLTPATQSVREAMRIMEKLRAGETWSGEFLVRRRDGSTFLAAVTDTPVLDADGALTGIIGASHEIGPRRRDESVAIVGHELLSPLSAISTALEIASIDPSAFEPTVAQRQVRHMARLIEDLLDASGLERGQMTLRKQAVDLREVVLRALDLTVPGIEEKRQALDVAMPPGTALFVEADRDRLVQVLTNLLGNANRYTSCGGTIALNLSVEGAHAVVTVADNGRGIDPEEHGRIFQPFTRGTGRPLDRANRGLGIGLALVRAIVELHGGEVAVSSRGRDLGSTFSVRLPLLT